MPPSLLFGALGLALAFAPRRAWAPSLVATGMTMSALALVPIPRSWLEYAFLACWISVATTAAMVHLPQGTSFTGAIALSVNAGVWATAVVKLAGAPVDLFEALPWVLLFLPAAWMVTKYGTVAPKVLSSWVIAVAVLAGALQLLSVIPGYMPDHIE